MNSPSNKKFDEYFEKIYGSRWPQLKQSLTQPEKQVLRLNYFSFDTLNFNFEKCEFLNHCFWRPENFKLEKNAAGLYPFYAMDPASVIVALALEVKGSDQVLDLCASPGGKALILAEQMIQNSESVTGALIANEMSQSRREKLMRILHEYIPRDKRLFIHVKGLDGNQYGLRQPAHFDRVLADVPCSGERHLLENTKEFLSWTESRTKNLGIRQYSLLSSAWFALKPAGRLVYSTCTISPVENDRVVAQLIKKRKPAVLRPEILNRFECLERTEFGYQILPDRNGFGPMYFAVLEKT